MVELYQHQETMKQSGGLGLSTGVKEIDQENGGFHPGQMVVIGARPSVGKSALAGSIALHAALNGHKVGIISLEMSNTEIAARLAALDTNTDFSVLYRGLYRDEYQTQAVYDKIGNHTSQLPIYVTDKTNVNVIEIRSKADKLKSLHGLDLLIIDYLQLIDVPEMYNRTRENEIAKVSRYTKIMAKELNIPVVLLCQLNRESTKRTGEHRYPQLSDLRESGSIEQDADVVLFLHRDYMNGLSTNEDGSSTEFQADLVVRKWRNGKNNFIIPMDFDPPKMKFVSRGIFNGETSNNWQPIR
jgi:replicative DNA helicase